MCTHVSSDNKGSSLEAAVESAGKEGFRVPHTPLRILPATRSVAPIFGQGRLGGHSSLGTWMLWDVHCFVQKIGYIFRPSPMAITSTPSQEPGKKNWEQRLGKDRVRGSSQGQAARVQGDRLSLEPLLFGELITCEMILP